MPAPPGSSRQKFTLQNGGACKTRLFSAPCKLPKGGHRPANCLCLSTFRTYTTLLQSCAGSKTPLHETTKCNVPSIEESEARGLKLARWELERSVNCKYCKDCIVNGRLTPPRQLEAYWAGLSSERTAHDDKNRKDWMQNKMWSWVPQGTQRQDWQTDWPTGRQS